MKILETKLSDYTPLTDSQDVAAVCEYYGIKDDDVTGALVLVGDGDYESVYLTESNKPWSIYANWHPLEYYQQE